MKKIKKTENVEVDKIKPVASESSDKINAKGIASRIDNLLE